MTQVDDWIRNEVNGRDFADVGGLWGVVNEKVSCAANANARTVTMLDITEPDAPLWNQFRDRCNAAGVSKCRHLSIDVLEDSVVSRAGVFDVIHCSGLLYHCAEPLRLLARLREICRGTLIIGSTVIPSGELSQRGSFECTPGGALFVPALRLEQRRMAADYFRRVGATTMEGLDTNEDWNERHYHPWWWLFTVEHVRALVEVSGFVVTDTHTTWEGRVAYFKAFRNRDEESDPVCDGRPI